MAAVGASMVISTMSAAARAAGIVTVTHMIVVQSGVAATSAMIVIVMVLVSMAMASMFFAVATT